MAGADPGRRRFLTSGLCFVVSTALLRQVKADQPPPADPALVTPAPASSAPVPGAPAPEARALTFFNTHTGEELTAVYFRTGSSDAAALAQFDRILRDHRSGEVGHMDPPLFDYLFDVARLAGVPPQFEVISGFRSPASNEYLRKTGGGGVAEKSLHLAGKAIDVRLRGVTIERLRDLALGMKRGGVGYYPQSRFVHLDTGRVRRWNGK